MCPSADLKKYCNILIKRYRETLDWPRSCLKTEANYEMKQIKYSLITSSLYCLRVGDLNFTSVGLVGLRVSKWRMSRGVYPVI